MIITLFILLSLGIFTLSHETNEFIEVSNITMSFGDNNYTCNGLSGVSEMSINTNSYLYENKKYKNMILIIDLDSATQRRIGLFILLGHDLIISTWW